MSRRVLKYATGQEIPNGAVYVSTQVEKRTEAWKKTNPGEEGFISQDTNTFVWHYFLVHDDPTLPPAAQIAEDA